MDWYPQAPLRCFRLAAGFFFEKRLLLPLLLLPLLRLPPLLLPLLLPPLTLLSLLLLPLSLLPLLLLPPLLSPLSLLPLSLLPLLRLPLLRVPLSLSHVTRIPSPSALHFALGFTSLVNTWVWRSVGRLRYGVEIFCLELPFFAVVVSMHPSLWPTMIAIIEHQTNMYLQLLVISLALKNIL